MSNDLSVLLETVNGTTHITLTDAGNNVVGEIDVKGTVTNDDIVSTDDLL